MAPAGDGVDTLDVEGDVGVAAWISCAGALPWGQPSDQRVDDVRSLTYDWPIGGGGVAPGEVLGNPRVALRVRSSAPVAHVAVKLCDVFPDGTSALITRGMLNLTHRGSWPAAAGGTPGREPEPLVPGEWVDVEIEFEATTWTLVEGHALRLAVAGTDWPNCWPPPAPVTLELDRAAVTLSVPVVEGLAESTHRFGAGRGTVARRCRRRGVADRARRTRPGDEGGHPLRRLVSRRPRGAGHRRVRRDGGRVDGRPGSSVGQGPGGVHDHVAGRRSVATSRARPRRRSTCAPTPSTTTSRSGSPPPSTTSRSASGRGRRRSPALLQ